MTLDSTARSELALRLAELGDVTVRVSDDLYARHPEWAARFGEAGRRRCAQDGGFHLAHLAGAVQLGRPEIFADYARWTASLLAARGIDAAHLIEHLELMGAALSEGLDRGQADMVVAIIEEARAGLALPPSIATATTIDDRAPTLQAYLDATLRGRRGEAIAVALGALRSGWTLEAVYRDLLVASQRRLGELWAAGSISVAQEHTASAVSQNALARLYDEIPRAAEPAGRAVISGIEGELHSLPAHIAADLLERSGWDVVFVGTNTPASAIADAVDEHQPDAIGLSTTMVSNLVRTVELTRLLQHRFPRVPIVLGGRALRGADALALELGVGIDATGDLEAFRSLRVDATGPTRRPATT